MEEVISSEEALCTQLAAQGLLGKDQLRIGLVESRRSGEALDKVLIRLGFVTDSLLTRALIEQSSDSAALPVVDDIDLLSVLPDPEALALVTIEVARRHQLVPVSLKEKQLLVATTDPYDLPAQDRLRSLLGSNISLQLVLAGEREILETIDRFYGFELTIDGILHEIETGEFAGGNFDGVPDDGYHQPVIRLVDSILIDAVKHGASDIHFEPEDAYLRVRYRIDGVMRQIRSFHIDYWAAVVVRIKVLSELNIAESRAPQDGQLSMNVAGGVIEFRVSCMPTVHGENIVLRILDRQKGIVALDELGLQPHALQSLLKSMERPEGLILITGPTGSGKTTTLYSMLAHKSDERINIMTLEDPVEYPMSLIRQTSVNDQVKLDFGTGIKSILRQDPDVILVGEIRDNEVAEMVFRASMTGHQVYSTLHANSAVGAIARLKDLGVSPSVIGGSVITIVAQRLVRKLCTACRVQDAQQMKLTTELDLPEKDNGENGTVYLAVGCELCDHQGYKGRVAVIEALRFTKALSELVVSDASASSIMDHAMQDGFNPLSREARRLVYDGVTSMEEISRVVDFS